MAFYKVVSLSSVHIDFGNGVYQSRALGEVFDADPTLQDVQENLKAKPPNIVAFTPGTAFVASPVGLANGTATLDDTGTIPVAQLPGATALDAEVTSAISDHAALAVLDADYNAQTVMLAVADDTPVATTVGTNTIVGRAAGDIAVLSATDARTVLNVEDNADVTDTANVQLAGAPVWQKYTVPFGSFTAAATTEDIELFSLPAAATIHAVRIKHSTSFTGGSISAYTLSVGIAGTLDKYGTAFDVFQATGATVSQEENIIGAESQSGATSIRIEATSTSDDLANASAGSADIWAMVSQTA